MNNVLLFSLIISLITILPLAFANTIYTDLNMDKTNGNVKIFWDYSTLNNVDYCTLTTHIAKFYAVESNQLPLVREFNYDVYDDNGYVSYGIFNDGKIIKKKYGYMGYLDLGTKTSTPYAMNLLKNPSFEVLVNNGTSAERLVTHEDAKVNCNDSLVINLAVFDYLELTEFGGGDAWSALRVFNTTGHIVREDVITTQFTNWIYPEERKNICTFIKPNNITPNGYMEQFIFSNSSQKAYADNVSCPANYITFEEANFSITFSTQKGSFNFPPTLGVDPHNKRMVEGGFSYNENKVDAEYFHTEYPLITTDVGKTNTLELVIYDDRGINNIKWIQLLLGVKEIGKSINESEVVSQLILTNTVIDELNITDNQNLIQNLNVTSIEPTKCKSSSNSEACLKVIFEYEYREDPIYNIVAVNLMNNQRNSWTFYFNDGVEVIGESINEPPTDSFTFRKANESVITTIHLQRTDKINNIWTDQFGIEYHQKTGRYDRITPMPEWKCNDTPLDQLMNGGTRSNCHFRALTSIWDK